MKYRKLIYGYSLMFLVLFVKLSYSDYYNYDGIHSDAGRMFFPFLNIGYEARSLGMAGADVGMPNGICGALSNPAAIGFITEMQAMISYRPIVLDIRGGMLAFAKPTERYGVFVFSSVYLSCGVFNPVDEDNRPVEGELHPYAIAGSISWARNIFDPFSVGVTLKGIYEQLSEGISGEYGECSADGFAVDVGLQYRLKSSRIIYGLLVKNLGFIRSSYSDDVEKTGLPLSFSSGFSYLFSNFPAVRFAFDLEKTLGDYLEYQLGVEVNFLKKIIFMRGGYSFSQKDLEEFFEMIREGAFDKEYQKSNWSFIDLGAGISAVVKDLNIDVNTSLNFKVDRMPISFALTFIIGF